MKAVLYERYGSPEVLRVVDVDIPEPGDGEVLIRVYASTLNRTDTGFRSAAYFISRFVTGMLKPKIKITGTEFAGKITAVGKSVSEYKVGDRVFGFDDSRFGAHAEYKVEPVAGPMAKIPKGFSYHEIAPAGEDATYALSGIRAARVTRGQKVLVYGATGAIGSAAVQICKHLGAHVTAVCGTAHVELVESLGAEKVIDYQREDFTQLDEKFDFIFDAVGKSSYGVCKKLLVSKGSYISTELGPHLENPFLAIWFAITGSRKVIFPIPKINKENIEYIKGLLEAGEYKPVIDRSYKLDEIIEATKYVESGQKIGNVIIKTSESRTELHL